jgi:hypothetical protein
MDAPTRFPTRIALVMHRDLAPWQTVNVAAFLASGITTDELKGEEYVDADGTRYLPLLAQPIVVHEGDARTLESVRSRAVERGMRVAVFDQGMFATGHDAANRDVVAAASGPELNLVGVAVHGAKNAVDRIMKGVDRHR